MSEIKVDTVKGRDGQVLLGDSGDTISVPSGATLTTTDATVNTGVVTATTESKTNKISPASGTAFTLGDSGDTFTVPSGVTMANSGTASGFGAGPVLIQSQTASSSATIDFTTGIDSTYDEYMFVFVNIHPASNGVYFTWQASTDGGSNYNTTCTTTMFRAYHQETGASSALNYDSGSDAAQSTSYINIDGQMANANDSGTSGIIHLFDPSSTTYVKQWYSTGNVMTHHADPNKYTQISYTAGYFNTASAVNAVSFKMQTGNIDAGTIKLYGVS